MRSSTMQRRRRIKIVRCRRRNKIGLPICVSLPLLVAAALALSIVAPAGATSVPAKPGPPSVSTGGLNHAKGRGATPLLGGTVDPDGAATAYYFQYGPTPAYGSATSVANLPAGTVRLRIGLPAPGIVPGEHYRLVASNAYGTTTGKDRVYSGPKKKKSAFTLPKSSTVPYGGTLIVTGTLPGVGNANRELVLQATPYPYRTPFVNVAAPVLTNAKGVFSFRVSHLTASSEYRVSTIEPRPMFSSSETVSVAVRVTLKVRSRGPKGLVRLYGTITPAEVGARVFVQLQKPTHGKGGKSEKTSRFSTEFTTVAKRATKSISRFSAVLTISRQGRYRAYVVIRRGPLVPGTSASVLLSASATPVTGKGHHKRKK